MNFPWPDWSTDAISAGSGEPLTTPDPEGKRPMTSERAYNFEPSHKAGPRDRHNAGGQKRADGISRT